MPRPCKGTDVCGGAACVHMTADDSATAVSACGRGRPWTELQQSTQPVPYAAMAGIITCAPCEQIRERRAGGISG